MLVTDKQYSLEKKYVKILDLLIKRIKGTDDAVLIVDGDEGIGKTELSVGTCYYVAYTTGRKYGIDNIFFNLDEVIKFASTTENQIIHFDEAALGLLLTQWQSKTQQQFIQLVMTARKKRHFIIICIPKFHRLPQYVMEERAIGLIHVYARKNMDKGRFCYFKRKNKDNLYQDWIHKKIKTYKKHKNFRGTFGIYSTRVFTSEEWAKYDIKKDEAIASITKEKKTLRESRAIEQRNKIIIWLKTSQNMSAMLLSNFLREIGVELSTTQIKDIVRNEKISHSGDVLTIKLLGGDIENTKESSLSE